MSRNDYPYVLEYDRDKAIRIMKDCRKKVKRLSKTSNITDMGIIYRAQGAADWIEMELLLSNKYEQTPRYSLKEQRANALRKEAGKPIIVKVRQ